MKVLFDQIPLDEMSVSMTMNGAVLPIMVFTLSLPRNKVSNPSYFPERYKTTFERVYGATPIFIRQLLP
jgi:methylmalonyl-CoA mutase N-terminal domain/subunit